MKKRVLFGLVLLTMVGASTAFGQETVINKKGVFVKDAIVNIVPFPYSGGRDKMTDFTVVSEAKTGGLRWEKQNYDRAMQQDGHYMVKAGWTITGTVKLDIYYGAKGSSTAVVMNAVIKSTPTKDSTGVNLELVSGHVFLDESQRSSLLLSFVSCVQTDKIEKWVDGLKKSGQTKDELADLIITRKSAKGGFIGAIAGIGSSIAAPVDALGELNKMCIKAEMAYALAYAYGYKPKDTEFENDLAILLGDDSAVKAALKEAAGLTPKELTKAAIGKITDSKKEELQKKLVAMMTKKLGAKVTKSVLGTVNVASSVIDVATSYSDAKSFGEKAKKYYKG